MSVGNRPSVLPEMANIPGGSIALRDDRTKQQWSVTVQPFSLGIHPVTQMQFLSLTGDSPSLFKGENMPVESLSWLEAVAFCNLLSREAGLSLCYEIVDADDEVVFDEASDGYRLPSEAEWEYACRAGSDAVRYGELDTIAWYEDNSDKQLHAVGLKRPNDWGLYDMLGNVWEWCWDKYDAEVYGSYRVFRGGGWADPARGCLATNRRRSHPTFKIDDLGFRVARSYVEPSRKFKGRT